MKNSNILWGIILVVIGLIFGLNALEKTNINIFFDGFWTLFIIIPCFIGLFKEKDKKGNLIGIFIGLFLLLSCQNIVDFDLLLKLLVPVVLVIIGLVSKNNFLLISSMLFIPYKEIYFLYLNIF